MDIKQANSDLSDSIAKRDTSTLDVPIALCTLREELLQLSDRLSHMDHQVVSLTSILDPIMAPVEKVAESADGPENHKDPNMAYSPRTILGESITSITRTARNIGHAMDEITTKINNLTHRVEL